MEKVCTVTQFRLGEGGGGGDTIGGGGGSANREPGSHMVAHGKTMSSAVCLMSLKPPEISPQT